MVQGRLPEEVLTTCIRVFHLKEDFGCSLRLREEGLEALQCASWRCIATLMELTEVEEFEVVWMVMKTRVNG